MDCGPHPVELDHKPPDVLAIHCNNQLLGCPVILLIYCLACIHAHGVIIYMCYTMMNHIILCFIPKLSQNGIMSDSPSRILTSAW